jgi:hypothetical protein
MNDFKAIANRYAKKNRHYTKQYKSFEIWKKTIDTLGLSVYYVTPNTNPFAPSLDSLSLKILPTHFIKINKNYYFWREDDYELPRDEVINQLVDIGIFDSTFIKIDLGITSVDEADIPSLMTDEKIKTAKYVICNNSGKIIHSLFSSYATSTEIPKSIKCE